MKYYQPQTSCIPILMRNPWNWPCIKLYQVRIPRQSLGSIRSLTQWCAMIPLWVVPSQRLLDGVSKKREGVWNTHPERVRLFCFLMSLTVVWVPVDFLKSIHLDEGDITNLHGLHCYKGGGGLAIPTHHQIHDLWRSLGYSMNLGILWLKKLEEIISPRKKPLLLSMKSWLFSRDSYNGI